MSNLFIEKINKIPKIKIQIKSTKKNIDREEKEKKIQVRIYLIKKSNPIYNHYIYTINR